MSTPFHQRYLADGQRKNVFLPLGVEDAPARAASKKAPVVVTGQQVGLFLGPLYTVAKAASAVAWAKKLGCQPLFWLPTEDHDFAEIDHCWLPGLKLQIAGDARRVPVIERVLGDDIEQVHARTAEALAGRPFADETCALLRRHYRVGASMADAFAGVLHELFPTLRIFQPRTRENSEKVAPIIERALTRARDIDAVLAERSKALGKAGHADQIALRPGAALAFWHVDGERQRPTDIPAALAALKMDPFQFSTSALLRPIVQDTLLETALYVGGPAEVDYFAQAACLYGVFDLPPPIVALRGRIRLITPRIAATLGKLGLVPSDVDNDAALAQKLVSPNVDAPSKAWLNELDTRLDRLSGKDVMKARKSIHGAMARLERRFAFEQLTKDETLRARADKLRKWLRPNGDPQERVLSFVPFAAQVGIRSLIDAITAAIEPEKPQLKDVYL